MQMLNRSDKIFITIMVLLICFTWLFGLHQFSKWRNYNGINVTWKATWEIPADAVKFSVQFFTTWDSKQERFDNMDKQTKYLKEILTWDEVTVDTERDNGAYDNPERCYFDNIERNYPCAVKSMTFRIDDCDIEEASNIIDKKLRGLDRLNTIWRNIWVENQNNEKMIELQDQANHDALNRAEKTANTLGVKLWKLLVFSENSNGYQENYVYYQKIPDSFMVKVTAVVNHTYAIK